MNEYSIGYSFSPFVGLKCECHEDKDIYLKLKIIDFKRKILYDQDIESLI
jgi:hypothetical protein